MKPNKDWLEAYKSRVSEFEKQEAKTAAPKKVAKAEKETPLNPYLEARLKVLKGYKKETLDALAKAEKTGNVDCKEYEKFIKDLLLAAGDIPTHGLFNRTQECGCFQCRGGK